MGFSYASWIMGRREKVVLNEMQNTSSPSAAMRFAVPHTLLFTCAGGCLAICEYKPGDSAVFIAQLNADIQ